MAKKLMFYSPDGSNIRICLPDGRVAIVGETPRELHASFNKAAIRSGCLTTDMPTADRLAGPAVPAGADPFERREAIKARIHDALQQEEGAPGYDEAFTGAGIPNVHWLSEAVGFTVDRTERDELWREVQAEVEAGLEEEDEERETGGQGGEGGSEDRGDNLSVE